MVEHINHSPILIAYNVGVDGSESVATIANINPRIDENLRTEGMDAFLRGNNLAVINQVLYGDGRWVPLPNLGDWSLPNRLFEVINSGNLTITTENGNLQQTLQLGFDVPQRRVDWEAIEAINTPAEDAPNAQWFAFRKVFGIAASSSPFLLQPAHVATYLEGITALSGVLSADIKITFRSYDNENFDIIYHNEGDSFSLINNNTATNLDMDGLNSYFLELPNQGNLHFVILDVSATTNDPDLKKMIQIYMSANPEIDRDRMRLLMYADPVNTQVTLTLSPDGQVISGIKIIHNIHFVDQTHIMTYTITPDRPSGRDIISIDQYVDHTLENQATQELVGVQESIQETIGSISRTIVPGIPTNRTFLPVSPSFVRQFEGSLADFDPNYAYGVRAIFILQDTTRIVIASDPQNNENVPEEPFINNSGVEYIGYDIFLQSIHTGWPAISGMVHRETGVGVPEGSLLQVRFNPDGSIEFINIRIGGVSLMYHLRPTDVPNTFGWGWTTTTRNTGDPEQEENLFPSPKLTEVTKENIYTFKNKPVPALEIAPAFEQEVFTVKKGQFETKKGAFLPEGKYIRINGYQVQNIGTGVIYNALRSDTNRR